MPISLNTPVGRLSYPNLFSARTVTGADGKVSDPKFGAVLILEPSSCDAIKAAIIEAAKEKWGEKALDGLRAGRLKNPLRDGNQKDDPAYAGKFFLGANGKTKPGLIDARGNPVHDASLVYPGLYARFNVTFFTYDMQMNKGVGVGLNHVQIVAAGERLDNRTTADKAFGDGATFDGYDTSSFEAAANPFD